MSVSVSLEALSAADLVDRGVLSLESSPEQALSVSAVAARLASVTEVTFVCLMFATLTIIWAQRGTKTGDTLGFMDQLRFHEIDSPIGRIGLVVSPAGVAKVLFDTDDIDAERDRIGAESEAIIPLAAHQLTEYFQGRRREFTVPVDYRFATGFREGVLRELARVPHGQTTTYGELASKIGNSKAVRAVGGACANNPLPLLIPCHRVLRSDGSLGGYRAGVETKRFLLDLEGIDVADIP